MTPFTHAVQAYADALYNHPFTKALMDAWDGDRIIEVDGVRFRMTSDWTTLRPGDTYVAGRNRGLELLTVREVRPHLGARGEYAGCVCATDPYAYPV